MTENLKFKVLSRKDNPELAKIENVNPPYTWRYIYSKAKIGNQVNFQTKITILDRANKQYERHDDILIDLDASYPDLTNNMIADLLRRGITGYAIDLGLSPNDIQSVIVDPLDESREAHIH